MPRGEREQKLRAGGKESTELAYASLVLYWEPYGEYDKKTGEHTTHHAFTIDYMRAVGEPHYQRWRCATLEAADFKINELIAAHAVWIAKRAFGLN